MSTIVVSYRKYEPTVGGRMEISNKDCRTSTRRDVINVSSLKRDVIIETVWNLPYYKIMSPFVFYIENMNRGLAVAWKYQTRLAEFDISMRTSTRGSYFRYGTQYG